jgi:hypothetical protein
MLSEILLVVIRLSLSLIIFKVFISFTLSITILISIPNLIKLYNLNIFNSHFLYAQMQIDLFNDITSSYLHHQHVLLYYNYSIITSL